MSHFYPGSQPSIALRTIAKRGQIRAIEVSEAFKTRNRPSNIWVVMRRLLDRGAVRVSKYVDCAENNGRAPLFTVTPKGRRILGALDVEDR